MSQRLVIDAVAGFIDLATRSLVSLTLPLADQGRSRANLLENKMEPEPSNLLKKRSRWSHSTSEYLQRDSHFQELVKLGLEGDVEEYWRTTHIRVTTCFVRVHHVGRGGAYAHLGPIVCCLSPVQGHQLQWNMGSDHK